jgi:glycosyltransferase involved in cell wall biosynthesis
MGHRPKSLLELGGVPLIRRQLIALSGAGMDEVVVVLGHYAALVEEAVKEFPVTLVRNPDPDAGQISSLRLGLQALSPKLDAALVALAAEAPNIQFVGWTSDAELADWVGRARATLYVPVDEDFGMSPVESMAAGKPGIGVAEGGLLETVLDGQTGVLLSPALGVAALCAAVESMTAERAREMRAACEARAQVFRSEVFEARIRALLA